MPKEPKITTVNISELIPDDANFNIGSPFGNSLIEKSLRKHGAGRSILIDKNNKIIAGNKTVENAGAIGLENVIIVEATGNDIIAVKRTDVDLNTKKGREMALADNSAAKANITWDFEKINLHFETQEQHDWGVVDFGEAETKEEENTPTTQTNYDFVIKCKNDEELQQLQQKLNTGTKTLTLSEFLVKSAL